MKTMIIAGAGLGGLSTALRLASRGVKVVILEKHSQAGGRLNQLKKEGFTFDIGPSFFSMSYEFEELFRDAKLPNPLKFNPLDPLYTVNFSGNPVNYRIFKDPEKLASEFATIETGFRDKCERYLLQARQIFHDTEYRVIKRNFSSRFDYLASLTSVPLKHGPLLFRSMWSELGKHFSSEEVKIIFSLVAFFLGATPFNTPAVYSLLNYTELKHDGYWNVQGGMYKIVEEILKLLYKLNVDIHYNTEVTDVSYADGKIIGFKDQTNKLWTGDAYVVNSDAAAFRGRVLKKERFKDEKLDKMQWTLAPFTIYLGVKGKVDQLHHHNYFLGNNFKKYADSIFRSSVTPDKPYYYVNVSSRSNPESAPEGCENIFILCPVPDLRIKNDWSDSEALADNIINDLSERTGFDLKSNTLTRTVYTPLDWEKQFNLYRGSGLGLAHGMSQVGGFRPANKDEDFNNLYYVGASTVPGTGLPMVVISSRLVTERIFKDYGRTF